jgi:uncharacterized protein (DUF362 family)
MIMKKLTRREFISNTALAGVATAVIPNNIFSDDDSGPMVTVASAKGSNYYKNTIKAIEKLGGIEKFVKKGDRVAILTNAAFRNPGAYVNPDIMLAVISMCMKAGSKEIIMLNDINPAYWNRGLQGEKHKAEIAALKTSSVKVMKEIPEAKILKYSEFTTELFDADVYINIPIGKHHHVTRFTGNLKNLMGAVHKSTPKRMHFPEGKTGEYIEFLDRLSQCIADINLVRMPDLCVCDLTEVLISNGPDGPGHIAKLQTVLAGTDGLAVDVLAASLIGQDPREILMFGFAAEHKLGESRLNKIKVI